MCRFAERRTWFYRLEFRDELVGDDLFHLLHGRREQLRRLHLLRVKPLSLGFRPERRVNPGHPLELELGDEPLDAVDAGGDGVGPSSSVALLARTILRCMS